MGSSLDVNRADSCTWERGGGDEDEGLSARSAFKERGVGGSDVYWERSFGGAPNVETDDGMDESGGTEDDSCFDRFLLGDEPAKKEELGGGNDSSSRNDEKRFRVDEDGV